MSTGAAAAACFVLALVLTPIAGRLLRRWRVLDHPSARSLHDTPTPRGAGVGPALAVLFTAAVGRQEMSLAGGVALAAGGLGLLGLFDDARGLRYLPRLVVQLTITVLAAFLLLGQTVQPLFWLPLAALWLMSYVNAYNFMDGANGVAAAQAIIAGATWWLIGVAQDLPTFALLGLLIAVAAAGFLPHNFPTANVFLGDTGSYFFGGWLGAMAVLGVALGLTPEAVVAPLAVFLADTGSTLVRRVRQRKPWYSAHREHVYQGLILHGWSHSRLSLPFSPRWS